MLRACKYQFSRSAAAPCAGLSRGCWCVSRVFRDQYERLEQRMSQFSLLGDEICLVTVHRLDAFYALHVHSFLPFAQFCIFLHRSFDGWTALRTRRPQRERAQTNGLRIAQNVAKSVNQGPSLEVKFRGGIPARIASGDTCYWLSSTQSELLDRSVPKKPGVTLCPPTS